MSPKATEKSRLDLLLVDRGLCPSRTQAQGLIMAGKVLVEGQRVDKPGTLCPVDAEIEVKESLKYVSRGGLKLEKALQDLELDVTGRYCMDVGASTGGFTDCLLQSGAAWVASIDVGYNQLDWRLRQDPRVLSFEKTHILNFDPAVLPEKPDFAVMDVSFISLKKVLPQVTACLDPESPRRTVIALIKPQFEYLDYCEIKGFNGVVTSEEDLKQVLTGVLQDLQGLLPGWLAKNLLESPIKGPKGNREFLLELVPLQTEESVEPWQALVTRVLS